MDWVPSARIRGDLTLFERRERDGIDYYRTSATDIWRALNIQNLNFKGWEAALRWTPSLTHNYPTKSGVFGWQITPRGNFVLRTRVGVIERTARSPYALWDIYAGLPRHKVHPYLQVSNATNTSYQSIPGVAMPGRTIVGGVEVVFRKR